MDDNIEDEIFIHDDLDVLDIIDFGFPRRNYLRPDYFNDMDDLSFFRRFRLTKPTVLSILEFIEGDLEFENDLNNSVSPVNQLLTALAFYASGGHQINLSDFMQMDQSTVSRIVKRVSLAIANKKDTFIKMPSTHAEIISTQTKFFEIARFPRVIGCIDGTHIKIESPGGEDAEIFRNRKGFFSINVQAVCDSELQINNIVARWPGSSHDATIFNNSRLKTQFEAGQLENSILLGDSGYALKPYLLTPLENPNTHAQRLYNDSQIRTRNCIKRTFGTWKRRFPAMCYGLRCNLENSLVIIVATAVLHNVARRMHNEIPPPPIGFDEPELEYLIQQGEIPPAVHQQNGHYDFRHELVNNYFVNFN